MTALQTSVMSLYEVSDLTPGQSFRARDLIRGGEPVLVSERSATQALTPWGRIGARIVPKGTSWSWPAGSSPSPRKDRISSSPPSRTACPTRADASSARR